MSITTTAAKHGTSHVSTESSTLPGEVEEDGTVDWEELSGSVGLTEGSVGVVGGAGGLVVASVGAVEVVGGIEAETANSR